MKVRLARSFRSVLNESNFSKDFVDDINEEIYWRDDGRNDALDEGTAGPA